MTVSGISETGSADESHVHFWHSILRLEFHEHFKFCLTVLPPASCFGTLSCARWHVCEADVQTVSRNWSGLKCIQLTEGKGVNWGRMSYKQSCGNVRVVMLLLSVNLK